MAGENNGNINTNGNFNINGSGQECPLYTQQSNR
jgi:hypothetical protein